MLTIEEMTRIADALYRRWENADREADEAQRHADSIHRQWVKAKAREQNAIRIPARRDNAECRWCGILDPACRLLWVGSRKCCPDCDHRPPDNVEDRSEEA